MPYTTVNIGDYKYINQARDFVLYGFFDAHEARNIAEDWYLRPLMNKKKKEHGVMLPYCTLDYKNDLIELAPKSYDKWPLEDLLATIGLFHSLCKRIKEINNTSLYFKRPIKYK